jgi:hypothetical protein
MPVHDLLGGKARRAAPVYVHADGSLPEADVLAAVACAPFPAVSAAVLAGDHAGLQACLMGVDPNTLTRSGKTLLGAIIDNVQLRSIKDEYPSEERTQFIGVCKRAYELLGTSCRTFVARSCLDPGSRPIPNRDVEQFYIHMASLDPHTWDANLHVFSGDSACIMAGLDSVWTQHGAYEAAISNVLKAAANSFSWLFKEADAAKLARELRNVMNCPTLSAVVPDVAQRKQLFHAEIASVLIHKLLGDLSTTVESGSSRVMHDVLDSEFAAKTFSSLLSRATGLQVLPGVHAKLSQPTLLFTGGLLGTTKCQSKHSPWVTFTTGHTIWTAGATSARRCYTSAGSDGSVCWK